MVVGVGCCVCGGGGLVFGLLIVDIGYDCMKLLVVLFFK